MIRTIVDNDLLTLLLLLVIVLLATAKLLDGKRFSDYFKVLVNSTYINTYGKDVKWFDTFNFILFLAFCLSLSIFIVVLNLYFNFARDLDVFVILIGTLIFFGTKIIIELALGRLLDSFNVFKLYLFKKLSYKYFMVFCFIPLSALFLFNDLLSLNYIKGLLIVGVAVQLIGYFIVIRSYFDVIKLNLFYFILYLCALEIAPYFILYKHIM